MAGKKPLHNYRESGEIGQDPSHPDQDVQESVFDQHAAAVQLSDRSDGAVLRRVGDNNSLPYLHLRLAFLYDLMFYSEAFNKTISRGYPWKLTAVYLNALFTVVSLVATTPQALQFVLNRIEGDMFPEVVGDPLADHRRRPLPEDFAMRGFLWATKYLPVLQLRVH